MKRSVIIYLLFSIFISCGNDNFQDTERYFVTDKEIYKVGDRLKLTTVIIPTIEQKQIRFYKNYKNLSLWFSLMSEKKGWHNTSSTKQSSASLNKANIQEHVITKQEPFQKTFDGIIKQENDSIKIEISELNFMEGFKVSEIDKFTRIRIHGFCHPINQNLLDPLEDYFKPKDITILVK